MSQSKMILNILTPEGFYFSEEINQLNISTKTGEIGVLPNHSKIFTNIKIGKATVYNNNKSRVAAVGEGVMLVKPDSIDLVVSSFLFLDSIDINKAKTKRDKLQKLLKQKTDDVILKSELNIILNQIQMLK